MSVKKLLAATMIAIISAGAANAATLVQNGSFEDVSELANGGLNRGNFGFYSAISGWQTGSGSGIELQNNKTLKTIDAQDGNWYVELDSYGNSAMYQDITFSKAGDYQLSFSYAPRTATPNDNGISYEIAGLTGIIDDVFPAGWRQVKGVFNIETAGVYRLSFAAEGTSNKVGGFVDNVSVAPVPLPATALLLGGALAGMGGFAARRRKNAKA